MWWADGRHFAAVGGLPNRNTSCDKVVNPAVSEEDKIPPLLISPFYRI